jgi:hypothetical protein
MRSATGREDVTHVLAALNQDAIARARLQLERLEAHLLRTQAADSAAGPGSDAAALTPLSQAGTE